MSLLSGLDARIPLTNGAAQAPGAYISSGETQTDDLPLNISKLAQDIEARGGVLAEHLVRLQNLATQRNLCIAIRVVNPDAKDLIREGCGTKDMEIKGKSSFIPPLCGYVPYDQTYGRDGSLPADKAQALTDKNEIAINNRKATLIDLAVSVSRFKAMRDLTIVGGWLTNPQVGASGAMIAKTAQGVFYFWGEVQADDTVSVFSCKKNGAQFQPGERIQVMGNRKGVAVTSDYDLAFTAPRIETHSSDHMRPIKFCAEYMHTMIAAREVKQHTLLAPEDRQVMFQLLPTATVTSENPTAESLLQEAIAAQENAESDYEAEPSLDGDLPPPRRRLGNISPFIRNLLPSLNRACGLKPGFEVFHHSDDAGNPFSVEKDNYPITLILPDHSDLPEDMPCFKIIEGRSELVDAIRMLKNAHFMPEVSYSWGNEVLEVRSRYYEEATSKMQRTNLSPKHSAHVMRSCDTSLATETMHNERE